MNSAAGWAELNEKPNEVEQVMHKRCSFIADITSNTVTWNFNAPWTG
jgi:hypothetical protein